MTLLAVEQIHRRHIIVKRKKVMTELHTVLKNLFSDKVVPHLHSCLTEIINTALARFEQLELVQVNTYGNKKGSTTSFLQGPPEMEGAMLEMVNYLQSLRPMTREQEERVEDEVKEALFRAMGLHVTEMAKL